MVPPDPFNASSVEVLEVIVEKTTACYVDMIVNAGVVTGAIEKIAASSKQKKR